MAGIFLATSDSIVFEFWKSHPVAILSTLKKKEWPGIQIFLSFINVRLQSISGAFEHSMLCVQEIYSLYNP